MSPADPVPDPTPDSSADRTTARAHEIPTGSADDRALADAAIIMAGGASTRMGGVDKTQARIGNLTVLERVIAAAPARRVIVVGPPPAVDEAAATHGSATTVAPSSATFVMEDPPGSGPLAAVARGAEELRELSAAAAEDSSAIVLVLGADMPLLQPRTLASLTAAARNDHRVHALRDDAGKVQYLCAAWPLLILTAGIAAINEAGGVTGAGLHRLYRSVENQVSLHAANAHETLDIDTPADLAMARDLAQREERNAPTE